MAQQSDIKFVVELAPDQFIKQVTTLENTVNSISKSLAAQMESLTAAAQAMAPALKQIYAETGSVEARLFEIGNSMRSLGGEVQKSFAPTLQELITASQTTQESFAAMAETMKTAGQSVAENLVPGLASAKEQIQQIGTDMSGLYENTAQKEELSANQNIMDTGVMGITTPTQAGEAAAFSFHNVSEAIKERIDKLAEFWGGKVEWMSQAWKKVTGKLHSTWKGASEKLKADFGALKEGFSKLFGTQLKNAFQQVGNSILSAVMATGQMQTAVGHVKQAFAQMISPIVQAVTPALAVLTNGLATVLAYLGRVFAFLTGKSIKATAATADSVADVGTTAGKTAKQVEKATRSLAGFDEIERLDAPQESTERRGGNTDKSEKRAFVQQEFCSPVCGRREMGGHIKTGGDFHEVV